MEFVKTDTGKKNFLAKTWKRCRSFPRGQGGVGGLVKSKMTPEGFIPVYVGQEKQRFAVKTKYVNHPLFTMLLKDAETEYGYNWDGPIWLPCDVGMFYNVLVEMEGEDVQGVGWSITYGSCSPFKPSRRLRLRIRCGDQMGKGYGSYEVLTHRSLM